jgi:predicted RND superfamily exporter protein
VDRRPDTLARRYVAWLRRRAVVIIASHVLVLGGAGFLIARHLPLYADFSYLLPQDAPAVRDLRKLEARVKTTDTVLVVLQAPDPAARAAAVAEMAAGIRGLPHDLVAEVEDDDATTRAFFRAHRHLFVTLQDLIAARDALGDRIRAAKLKANPLYVELDDDGDKAAEEAAQRRLDDLRAKRKEAEGRLDRSSNVSADGKTAMIQIHTTFPSTDVDHGEALVGELDHLRAKVSAAHPGVSMGFTGGNLTAVSEHAAIFKGIVLSSLITMVLVGLVLAFYFRSLTLLVLLIGALILATAVGFGAAALTVGHLNAATAFLGAIIAGNGINYGILLIARFLEELRRPFAPTGPGERAGDLPAVDRALARAIIGTLKPTAIASLGAAIAYGSLAATSFKGFADFAIIGATGMLLCWVASYMLLPALILRIGRHTRNFDGDPFVGGILVRLLGFRQSGLVLAVTGAIAIGAVVLVGRYVAADPFEYDIKQLRSEGEDAVVARRWMQISDRNFGRGFAGRTYIAADRLEQVPLIAQAIRDADAARPERLRTIGSVHSLQDVIPPGQDGKLAVLAEIRTLLDDDALTALDPNEQAELRELRPPDDLRAITPADLPPVLKDALTEKDGRIGYLISIHSANQLDEWNGHDLIRFADAVRTIKLPDGETVTTSGSSVIFADIVDSIERDGPIVTLVAAAALIVMVVLLVGFTRRALAVLAATLAGALLMIAACAILGLHVNFLDFIALPITLGIGIDYAINVAHRHDSDEVPDPIATLRTSGSAVFICSLTTMIGYGSLLVSDNLAIRGFGTASLIGEVACLLTALVLVPALLAVRAPRAPAAAIAAPAE